MVDKFLHFSSPTLSLFLLKKEICLSQGSRSEDIGESKNLKDKEI